jgi:signal peptidase II
VNLHRPPVAALVAAGAVLVVDQASKAVIWSQRGSLPLHLFGDVRLEETHNTGMSFSLLRGNPELLTVLVAVISAVVLILLFVVPRRYGLPLGLVLGGSLGNLVDRIRWGWVLDFFGVYWWPTLNIADLAIVAGAILLGWRILFQPPARDAGVQGSG